MLLVYGSGNVISSKRWVFGWDESPHGDRVACLKDKERQESDTGINIE